MTIIAPSLTDANGAIILTDAPAVINGSQSAAAVLFSVDTTGYQSISVQVTNPGTGCTVTLECSDDNTTWYSTNGRVPNDSGASAPFSSSGIAFIANFPIYARYFRARVSTYGSGTITTVAYLRNSPVMLSTQTNIGTVSAVATIAGGIGEGSPSTQQPVPIGGVSRTARYNPSSGVAVRHTLSTEASLTTTPGHPVSFQDVAAGTVATVSGASANVSTPVGGALGAVINVTAVSGTSPVIQFFLQESYDNGATFTSIYITNNISAIGTIIIPPLGVYGVRRWTWGVSGTTPSFTFGITTSQSHTAAPTNQPTYGTVAAGTAATKSDLIGVVYNPASPALSSGQQVAAQSDVAGNLFTTQGPSGGIFEINGSITTGGTAQSIATVGAPAIYEIQNTSSAALMFSLSTTATALSMQIQPGQTYATQKALLANVAVSLYGATTGQTYSIRQWK